MHYLPECQRHPPPPSPTSPHESTLPPNFDMGMGYDIYEVLHEVHAIKPRFHHFNVETLRLRFFRISREPRTSKCHVTRALASGLRFEVHVCTARQRSRGKWSTARFFCPLKQHNGPTFERKYNLLELFCLLIIEFYFRKVILKTFSQLK